MIRGSVAHIAVGREGDQLVLEGRKAAHVMDLALFVEGCNWLGANHLATTRAFCEKVESRWDSRESVFVIQASHWTGGQHEWGSHIRMTCDAASFKRLRLVIRTRKLRICAA